MSLVPTCPVTLSILSQPTCLPIVRAVMEKMCELIGFDSSATGGVILSVDEALTNIMRHAYGGAPDKPIEIEFVAQGQPQAPELKITLRDYGTFVDPARIHSRDLADVRPGGLGVHIISNCMDSVQFSPAPGGGTLLTLTKKLSSRQGSEK